MVYPEAKGGACTRLALLNYVQFPSQLSHEDPRCLGAIFRRHPYAPHHAAAAAAGTGNGLLK